MALNYGVLVGRPIGRKLGLLNSPHYQIHVIDETTDYRIAINIRSQDKSELLCFLSEDYQHSITNGLEDLGLGFHPLAPTPQSHALDFIRGNLFDRDQMRIIPAVSPGPDNDLDDKIDTYVQIALGDETALVYAFGARWGPENNKKDQYFGFLPGNGIHDIHMNQGNPPGPFAKDNGVYQDGALLLHFPNWQGSSQSRWVAIFLKFQTQAWHTDDAPDNPAVPVLPSPGTPIVVDTSGPAPGEPDGVVRIVAARVNPVGDDTGSETVTLLNASPDDIDLNGWQLADKAKNKQTLSGVLAGGASRLITVQLPVQLSNKGGIITLLNAQGLKVDGVSYTADQVSRQGWTLVF